MKKIIKYCVRALLGVGTSLVLSVIDCGLVLPVNILTGAASVFLGVPGIALSVVLCSCIFQ